jgi:hypothetical protein
VRIHRDPDAAHAAHDISARAFTVGQDIYFGAGQYDPGTKQGNRLLAHELTHTVQQGSGTVTAQADTPISSPTDPLEREAEAVAARIGNPSPHQPLRPQFTTPPIVQGSWYGSVVDAAVGGTRSADYKQGSGLTADDVAAMDRRQDETDGRSDEALGVQRQCDPGAPSAVLAPVDTTGNNIRQQVLRESAVSPAGGGPDPCLDLLQEIIDLLNEVAKRINDALDDPHDLFRFHRKIPHPEGHGSWEGHRDRFYYDRGRLRHKLGEWESDDDCTGRTLSEEQSSELQEARDYSEKEYPEKPAKAMREGSQENESSVWDTLRKYLPEIIVGTLLGLGLIAVGIALVACFASGACEFALALAGVGLVLAAGIAAALRAAGIEDRPSSEA